MLMIKPVSPSTNDFHLYNSLSDFGPMLLEEFNIIQPILVDGS